MAMQIYFGAVSNNLLINYLLYSRKISQEKNFPDFLLPKDATCSNFAEKTFANKHQNLQIYEIFSLKCFRYMVEN